MMLRIVLLWIIGGALIIPYAIYHLIFYAHRDEYAFLIVIPLFWVFGFWGVVGPAVAAWRIHRLFKALDMAQDSRQVRAAFEANEGKDVIIDLIASESGLPRFVARALYHRIQNRLLDRLPEQQVQRIP